MLKQIASGSQSVLVVASIGTRQVFANDGGQSRFHLTLADAHPSAETARTGLQHDEWCMALELPGQCARLIGGRPLSFIDGPAGQFDVGNLLIALQHISKCP